MEIIAIGAFALWLYTLHRGRLFVRAYTFLTLLAFGENPDVANAKALSVGYLAATDIAPMAKEFAAQHSRGKQLPIIAEARARGFRG